MKFNSLAIFGVLFVVLGIAGLAHPNVVMPAKKQELEIAGNKVIMETRRVVEIPKNSWSASGGCGWGCFVSEPGESESAPQVIATARVLASVMLVPFFLGNADLS